MMARLAKHARRRERLRLRCNAQRAALGAALAPIGLAARTLYALMRYR